MKYERAFLGAGKMAEGILSAIKAKKKVIMAERSPERAEYIRTKYGVKVVESSAEAASSASIVFIAVRPQDVESLAKEVKPSIARGQTIVSIVAGKTIKFLKRRLVQGRE